MDLWPWLTCASGALAVLAGVAAFLALRKLRRSQERYHTLFRNVPVGLYRNEVKPVGRLTLANPAIVRMFGYDSAEEFTAVEGDDFFADPAERATWARMLLGQGEADAEEIRLRRKDGSVFWGAITAEVFRDDAGEIECIDGMIQDVTRRKLAEQQLEEANRELERLATTDGLTGLLNRRTVLDGLERELGRCRRLGHPLAVVLADVDHFKRVNDTHGHLAGDRVLVRVARVLQASCRPYDLAGRYGGEELLLVLPETDADQARSAAERLRRAIADTPARLDTGQALSVTVSLGVAESAPGAEESVAGLVGRADDALYLAKDQGRDRVCVAAQAVPSPQR